MKSWKSQNRLPVKGTDHLQSFPIQCLRSYKEILMYKNKFIIVKKLRFTLITFSI